MARRRPLLLLLLAVLVPLTAGCEVAVKVLVTVEEDGSGTVEVAVGLDPEAMARVPAAADPDDETAPEADVGPDDEAEPEPHDPTVDLMALLRLDDLEAAGWVVHAPETLDDITWVRITKPFGTPDEADQVLAELTGPDGALADLQVNRSTSFGTDRFQFSGTADLSTGLAGFGDEGLAAVLEGEPLGEDEAAMEERYGAPVSDLFDLEVRVKLPGRDEQVWTPELGGAPLAMEVASTLRNPLAWTFAALAALCTLGLVGWFIIRSVRSSS